ncbi:hypothetical protein [Streptomyces sp. NPDC003278]
MFAAAAQLGAARRGWQTYFRGLDGDRTSSGTRSVTLGDRR